MVTTRTCLFWPNFEWAYQHEARKERWKRDRRYDQYKRKPMIKTNEADAKHEPTNWTSGTNAFLPSHRRARTNNFDKRRHRERGTAKALGDEKPNRNQPQE